MNQKKSGIVQFFKNKGFYLVLVVCVIAAAVSSYLAIETLVEQFTSDAPITFDNSTIDNFGFEQEAAAPDFDVPLTEIPDLEPLEPTQEVQLDEETETVMASQDEAVNEQEESVETELTPIPVEETITAPPAVPSEPITFSMPVAGEIIAPFSGDELVYNETMNDWRTHNGVDITAELDTPVVAIKAGVVTSVSIDDLWGGTVEIESDGILLRYCGLNPDISVQKGTELRSGEVIGRVGETPSEIAMDPHVHIEALRGEEYFSFTDLQ